MPRSTESLPPRCTHRIPQPLRSPNHGLGSHFVDRRLTQQLKQAPVPRLKRRPHEAREERVVRRDPGFREQPQQRPIPGPVIGVGLAAIEPVVNRGTGDSQDAGEFGLVDRQRRLKVPDLPRNGWRGDELRLQHEAADVTAVDSGTGRDPRQNLVRKAWVPLVQRLEEEPARGVPVPTKGCKLYRRGRESCQSSARSSSASTHMCNAVNGVTLSTLPSSSVMETVFSAYSDWPVPSTIFW